MRRRALGVVLAACLTGCVAVEGFDPVGSAAAIRGTWQIDSAPPTSDSCDALGASRVRISFLDDQRAVAHSGLFAACTEGGIDTRMGSNAVVGVGRWTVRLDALDSGGSIIATGSTADVTIEEGQSGADGGVPLIEVPTADFFTATVSASFTIDGASPSRDSCEAAGIERVGFSFDSLPSDGGHAETDPELCEVGVVGTRVRPSATGTYQIRLTAFAEDETEVASSAPQAVEVSSRDAIRFDADGAIDLVP